VQVLLNLSGLKTSFYRKKIIKFSLNHFSENLITEFILAQILKKQEIVKDMSRDHAVLM